MFGFGTGELTIIFLIILLLFGAKKLPEVAKAIGKAIREFRKVGKDIQDDIEQETKKEEDKKEL